MKIATHINGDYISVRARKKFEYMGEVWAVTPDQSSVGKLYNMYTVSHHRTGYRLCPYLRSPTIDGAIIASRIFMDKQGPEKVEKALNNLPTLNRK